MANAEELSVGVGAEVEEGGGGRERKMRSQTLLYPPAEPSAGECRGSKWNVPGEALTSVVSAVRKASSPTAAETMLAWQAGGASGNARISVSTT